MGKSPKYLPSTIFNRLPIRYNYNEDYFNNCFWQGIPAEGYTKVFENIIQNPKIRLDTRKEYNFEFDIEPRYATIYTGPLDKLFNYKFGKLGWRSLKFKKK